jgi:hypothetical protein
MPLICTSIQGFADRSDARPLSARSALLVRPLRAFQHSTNILVRETQVHGGLLKLAANGSGIDLIDDLEVGKDFLRCESFDFLLAQAVEPIKERTFLGGQLRRLFGARHSDWIMLSQRSVFPRMLPPMFHSAITIMPRALTPR